jgi:uncharacterized protein YndB with AHSA1/START domain
MAASSQIAASAMEKEITITRVFDAPRDLVFRAWTEEKHMQNWFGPKYFTNPVCEMDVRVGGKWRIVMRGPDGTDYPCGGVYREIIEPERLVFTNIATDYQGNPLLDGLTTVTFEEQGRKTKLTLHARAIGLVPYAPQMLAGMEEGWGQSLAALEELVAPHSRADRELVATRVFDAPREMVFDAWTHPEQVARWWGPNGFTTTIDKMDVRPGGVWQFIMHRPDGTDYNNLIIYVEIARPERLVYAHVSDPKFDSAVTFEEQDGKTKLTMRMLFGTAEEMATVIKVHGAAEGAKQHLARLAEFVATR